MFARINQAIMSRAAAIQVREDGQTMAEYGLILALVAVVLVAGFTLLQGGIAGTLADVVAKL